MKNKADIIFEKVRDYAKSANMELSGRIAVGLSGGADSVSLLLLLLQAGAEPVCVHVNHMIRGKEADRDEEFCKSLCKKYGVEFHAYRVDIPALSKERKTGTEETARVERKRILSEAAKEFDCGAVALAHNKNDRAETFIFNLARGTGIKGLGSIRPVKVESGTKFIRPLLCLTKDEILEYLNEENESHVFDSTNADDEYTRNYIRHTVLPSFCRINPSYLSNINRAAELADEADDLIETCAGEFISSKKSDKTSLLSLHPAVLKRVLSKLYLTSGGVSPEETHLKALCDFIKDAENGQRIGMPNEIDFICENGAFRFIKRSVPLTYRINLEFGENDIPCKKCKIFVENVNSAPKTDAYRNIYKIVKRIKISSDIIKNGVFVRNRADGDSIKYGGMTHEVKKILSEKKIPSSHRPDYPVICDKEGLLAVPPFAIRDGCEGDGQIYLTYCEYEGKENE